MLDHITFTHRYLSPYLLAKRWDSRRKILWNAGTHALYSLCCRFRLRGSGNPLRLISGGIPKSPSPFLLLAAPIVPPSPSEKLDLFLLLLLFHLSLCVGCRVYYVLCCVFHMRDAVAIARTPPDAASSLLFTSVCNTKGNSAVFSLSSCSSPNRLLLGQRRCNTEPVSLLYINILNVIRTQQLILKDRRFSLYRLDSYIFFLSTSTAEHCAASSLSVSLWHSCNSICAAVD